MIYNKKISPCIGICKLNDKKVCIGCHRTIEQIKKAFKKSK